jgi:hypothetical protein
MGAQRNGARTFLDVMAYACKLSRMPGFVTGGRTILGTDNFDTLYALWLPLCSFVDTLIALDNYYNKVDFQEEEVGSEDVAGI